VSELDLRAEIARIDRDQAETHKLMAEQRKLDAERAKFDREPWLTLLTALAGLTGVVLGALIVFLGRPS
jgi:hypothetical protein